MQTGVILAIALIPAYIVVLSAVVNVFLYRTRADFRNAFINPSHRVPATIRYLLPYPFSAYSIKETFSTSADSTTSGTGNTRETRQRTELRPVTLPPVSTSASSGTTAGNTATGAAGAGSQANRQTDRIITRGGRRWGRTGSQRSTQTLPLYSEDVGDEDVVLIAKRESMRSTRSTRSRRGAEDADIEEEGEESDEGSPREPEEAESRDMGLGDDSTTRDDLSAASTTRPDDIHRRERSESIVSSSSIYDRGWGEAPTYDDAMQNTPQMDSSFRTSADTVDRSDFSRIPTGGSQVPLTAATAGTGAGFKSFVNRLTGRFPAQGISGRYSSVGTDLRDAENGQMGASGASLESYAMTGRPRGFSDASGMSQLSVDTAAPRPSVSSGMNRLRSHTGIASANNSLVSLLLHPTISNQSTADGAIPHRFRGRSASNATTTSQDPSSPSASVVNLGISPPVPGSVIRSAYTQPRAGFSTEQLKFLSSTESLGKYGTTFGPDEATSGLGPSSRLHTTRNRSGSASSVGVVAGIGSHRRTRSSSAALNADTSNDGLPTFEDLIREEAAAEEQRRGSHSAIQSREAETSPVVQPLEEASPEDSTQIPRSSERQHQTQPPRLNLPSGLLNFDLEVVPPTPVVEENRRSFLA